MSGYRGILADPNDISGMVKVGEIRWASAPTPAPSSRDVIALGIALLATIADDIEADLSEHLLLTLVDRDADLRVVREVLSAALTQSHAQRVEIVRLQAALARLRDEYRHLRVQTLQKSEAA